MARDLALGDQNNWEYYDGEDSPEGAYLGWIRSGDSLNGTIALGRNLTPKRYYIFLKVIDYTGGGRIAVSLGGGKAAISPDDRDWNRYWTLPASLLAAAAANIINITLFKTDPSDPSQKYLLRGLYLTTDSTELVTSDDRIIKLRHDSGAHPRPPAKGNKIENSSFEVGTGHGWGTPFSNRNFPLAAMWDNAVAYHSTASLKLPPEGEIISKVYRLKPNQRYTLSAWVKSNGAATCELTFSNVSAAIPGFPNPADVSQAFQVGSAWWRVSMSGEILNPQTCYYQVKVYARSAAGTYTWVDAIQLEEGDLSDYDTPKPVEIGMMTDHASNIFFEDEPVLMNLLVHNNGSQTTSNSLRYEIYDYLNREIKKDSLAVSVFAKSTSRNILDLSTSKRGIFRVVLWLDHENNTEEEVAYSILPRPRQLGVDENSIIGIHPNFVNFQLEALQNMGIKWARVLSPAAFFRWSVVEPVEGNLIWHDQEVQSAQRHGLTILGTIGTNDYWPDWADRGGVPDLDKWEAFVEKLVRHYKNDLHYWEIWNEPIYNFTASFYAELLKRAALAIRRNDPTAKIVGMGGVYDYQWILEVIGYLGNNWSSYMDFISTHLYYEGSLSAEDFRNNIIDKMNIPVWNTEAGVWDLGFYQGSNSNFFIQGETIWPHHDGERYYEGALGAAEALAVNFLQSIGNGLSRYFYYDSRLIVHPGYFEWHPTILEYDDTIRCKGIAYAILAYLFDHSRGLGNISTDPNTYAYLFDRDGTPLVALWATDQSNKTISLPMSQFKVYDIMGNETPVTGAAIKYNRTPVYLEAQGLPVDQMRASFGQGTVSNGSDNTPPNLSLTSCPTGPTHDRSLQLRWIAIDESSIPSTIKPFAILYTYQLQGHDATSSPWTAKTYTDYSDLVPGTYTFCVQARDEQGNLSPKVCKEIIITPAAIAPPRNLRATFRPLHDSSPRVELSWNPSKDSNASVYGLYRSSRIDSSFTLLNTIRHPDSIYIDSDLRQNSRYFYTATLFDRQGNESGFSNIVEIFVPLVTSAEFTDLSGYAQDDDAVLELTIAAAPANRSFEIQRRADLVAEFKKIGSEIGLGQTESTKKYRFIDKDLAVGDYEYRVQQTLATGEWSFSEIVHIHISLPTEFRLYQNRPNPFNSSTMIAYSLPRESHVEFKVYDLNGQEIKKLVDEFQTAGRYKIHWQGVDSRGNKVASGVYYYRINTIHGAKFGKMILLE